MFHPWRPRSPHPDESFSDAVMRAEWPEVGITARELREIYRTKGPALIADALDRVETALRADRPPEDLPIP